MIAEHAQDCRDTFATDREFVLCDLGGVFLPTCVEMRELVSSGLNKVYFDGIRPQCLSYGESLQFDNPAYRLYYEIFRQDTCLTNVELSISGRGTFEVSIVAHRGTRSTDAFAETVCFDSEIQDLCLGPLAITSLPPNGSLAVTVKCLSEHGYINGFRWMGRAPIAQINTGKRIIVIRTYQNGPQVVTNLRRQLSILAQNHGAMLNRFLFVIYHASDVLPTVYGGFENGNIVELHGPNYGGGGNASFLISLLLQIDVESVAEVCIIDDDALFDVETLLRYDAFVTMRTTQNITSAAIFARTHPTVIQECGGFWERYISHGEHSLEVNCEKSPQCLAYLVQNLKDVTTPTAVSGLGEYQHVDFAPFIYISFPFNVLKTIGAPLPFFLRNDDVEFGLRANQKDCRTVVNPNLQVWHEANNTPTGEFYSCLHGLIVSSAYTVLDKTTFLRTYFDRFSKLSSVRNIVLMKSYEFALHLFLHGPDWMTDRNIFSMYNQACAALQNAKDTHLLKIPDEIKDACMSRVNVVSIVDNSPIFKNGKHTILSDIASRQFYSLKEDGLDDAVQQSLEKCISTLNEIHLKFTILRERWKQFVHCFDHNNFWKIFHQQDCISIISINSKTYDKVVDKPDYPHFNMDASKEWSKAKANNESTVENAAPSPSQEIPNDFDPLEYLNLNPDVAASGVDPVTHYLTHGKFENRMY